MILKRLINGEVVSKRVNSVVFDMQTDVLCVGAGSAGVYLADTAKSEGVDVVLLELSSNVGGMYVKGNVTGFYLGSEGGTFEKDVEASLKDTVFYSEESNWEQKQIRVTKRLKKNGVKVLTRHSATGVYFEKNRAVGLQVFGGKRIINIKSKIIVDATSDGHLIKMIGTSLQFGRDIDGASAPFTVRRQYLSNGKFISNNGDSGHVNQYDDVAFSRAVISARASAKKFVKEKEFISLASQTGVREGLTFEGEERLDYKSVIYQKPINKVLFYAYSDLDRHGYDRALDEKEFQNWWVISNLSTVAINILVPMGAVVPKGVKGLITAGRCLSADCYIQSAVRMNKDMFRMGECLGVATAISVKSGVDILDIDYDLYLEKVEKRGCFKGFKDRNFCFQTNKLWYDNKVKTLGLIPDKKYDNLAPSDEIIFPINFDLDKNFHLLKTREPGVALWSCYVYKDRKAIQDKLYNEMINASNTLYKYNLAIALGLVEDRRSLKTLREIVKNRDNYYFTDNRRSNQFRSVIAVCLIGRLGELSDLNLLQEILFDEEFEKDIYHNLEPNYLFHRHSDRKFLYFQMITHTIVSIIRICKRLGVQDGEIQLKQLNQKKFIDRIVINGNKQALEETKNFFNSLSKIK